MFSTFCKKLLLKMGNIFYEISKKPFVRSYRGGWMGGWVFNQKRARMYRAGGLVKNVMILSVRTLWMTPLLNTHCIESLPYLWIH